MDFDLEHIRRAFPFLLEGIRLTIQITVIGLIFGFILGAILGMARTRQKGIIYGVATSIIEIVRGTPIVVQALWIYFAVPMVTPIGFDRITASIIAIAVNSGAYIS